MNLKKYKKTIICVFILAFICALFDTATEEPINTQEVKEVQETAKKPTNTPSEEPTKEPTSKPTSKPTEKPTEVKLNLELGKIILENSFKDVADIKVDYDNNCINIIPLDGFDFMYEFQQACDGDIQSYNNWEVLVNSTVEISEGLEENIIISIVNPINKENTLLMVMNGEVAYNAINE